MGGVDYLTNKEIGLLKNDIEASEVALQAQQITLANSLKNGIGEDILNTLNGVTPVVAKKEKKTWFKWLKRKS
jgi:hypothetical protein